MAKRPEFFKGGFYHVYNRGTDKRDITTDFIDQARFVYDLFAFNTKYPAVMTADRFKQFGGWTSEHKGISKRGSDSRGERVFKFGGWTSELESDERHRARKELVDIVAWALMPNHYHLLVRQRVDDGVSEYMKKLGAGYTLFFNERHERSGALFQGKYKVKQVLDDEYLRHLVAYIHLNSLAIALPKWEKKGSGGTDALVRELLKYRWSSLRDYLGDENFKSVLSWKQIRELGLPIEKEQYNVLKDWLRDFEGFYGEISDVAIDDLSN